jgi:signal transduction histidine kinase
MESMTADAVKVRKVLCNLLSNAIKFTSDGGNVHIAAVLRDNGKFVEFSVEDSGLGISPTEQEKIFQPFTQLDSTYAKKPEGTGLGLSLCRKIVELHGGNIRVRSETGNGSFFYFTIPRLTRA